MKKAISFVAFVEGVLRVVLTLGQRALALVAFDGVELAALSAELQEIGRKLFGALDTIPAEARHVVAVVAGARGGKTYLSALRLLHLAVTTRLRLAPGEQAYAIFVAPDMRLARQGLRYALGAAQAHRELAALVEDESADGFTLRRPDGLRVRFEALPATRGGSALRGRTLVGAVLDEAAFFRGEDAAVNDLEIDRAVVARVVAGGQVLVVSTPWAEAGLLFDLHRENFGHARAAIAAHAPTVLLRDDARTLAMVERETARDPSAAAREFGAEWLSAGSDLFFDPVAVDACAVDTMPTSDERRCIAAGADFGFRSDSSALAIVAAVGSADVHLLDLFELRPTRGAPLRPSDVVAQFAEKIRAHGIRGAMADGHYRESIAEHLSTHGLRFDPAPEGQGGKTETYLHLRKLVNEGRLYLPRDARLLRQLKSIVAKPTPGGGLVISAPRRGGGGHGDLVSALVLAAWAARQLAPYRGSLFDPRAKRIRLFSGGEL